MVSICAVSVLCDELNSVRALVDRYLKESANRVAIIIFLGVYARACSAVCSHRLVSILPEVKNILLLVVVHTLDHLWPDQGAFCNDSFE